MLEFPKTAGKKGMDGFTNKSVDGDDEGNGQRQLEDDDSSIASIFGSDDDLSESEDNVPKIGQKRIHHEFDHAKS